MKGGYASSLGGKLKKKKKKKKKKGKFGPHTLESIAWGLPTFDENSMRYYEV